MMETDLLFGITVFFLRNFLTSYQLTFNGLPTLICGQIYWLYQCFSDWYPLLYPKLSESSNHMVFIFESCGMHSIMSYTSFIYDNILLCSSIVLSIMKWIVLSYWIIFRKFNYVDLIRKIKEVSLTFKFLVEFKIWNTTLTHVRNSGPAQSKLYLKQCNVLTGMSFQ